MGRDTTAVKKHHAQRSEPSSSNPYIYLLVKIYRFLTRRAACPFNKVVLHRLMMSRTNLPPMTLSRLALNMKGKDGKTCVVVGTVTDDTRLAEVPKMKVAALRFTETARARILKAGGEVMTLDQLAMTAPKGSNTVLLRGKRSARTVYKYFGAPGVPGSHARPRISSKTQTGRKHERGRGRRASKAFKVKA
ncbi:60S ribosomal protein L18-B [Diplonema papillatum]|nr:60S ribosomal protein L18-B [Diplonema papillatum]